MPSLNDAFGLHPQAMTLRARRAAIISANLANADTPHYKARDVDFKDVFGDQDSVAMVRTRPAHLASGSDYLLGAELKYRAPTQASLDQNTVDVAMERARFLDNAMRYQASVRFLDGKIAALKSALRGE